nr:MAG TPA: hypothetical protein [Caudoviricetes sp.]
MNTKKRKKLLTCLYRHYIIIIVSEQTRKGAGYLELYT